MISADRLIIVLAALALFALLAVEGSLVYSAYRSVGQAQQTTEEVVQRVSANTSEPPQSSGQVQASEIIMRWEHLPVSEPLRTADFYPSPGSARRQRP